ncbi:hypothetical protein MHYP_G00014490 [Metynnis hypsauchen]
MRTVHCGGGCRGRNKLVSEPAESPDGLADSHKPCSDSTVSAHWPIVLPQRPAHPSSPTWPTAKELKSSLSLGELGLVCLRKPRVNTHQQAHQYRGLICYQGAIRAQQCNTMARKA